MQAEVFDRTIITFKRQVPFQPFTISLVNGDRYEVDHPDVLAVRDGTAVCLAPGGFPVIFDHEGVSQIIGDLKNQEAS